MRDGDLKLTVRRDNLQPTHCFDLAVDPYELRNLVDSTQHTGERDRLLGLLRDWDRHVSATCRYR